MHLKKYTGTRHLLLLAAGVAAAATLHAGEPVITTSGKSSKDVVTTTTKEESIYDKIWGLATIYKNKDNPVIQEFKLRGRYQGQYHWVDSDQGEEDSWEDRRSRFGFDAKLFNQFEVRLDAQSSDGFDPFYNGLVDAFVKWKPSDSFALTVGRQKPQIAYYDFLQSTNNQPTFERSQIFNQLRVDRVTGAVFEGKVKNFTWQAGIYSNDIDLEFGQFNAGIAYGAGVGYNLKEALGTDKADLRVDWLHSESDDENATILDRYEDLFTTTFWLKEGRFGLVTEFFLATGGDTGWDDAFGFFIQPTFDIV
ncbi:MAG TPA: porin, partial [Candidatus Saccharimonadia bacterium]|nr:porin [Candidatus Saccharimonadia bacterium]